MLVEGDRVRAQRAARQGAAAVQRVHQCGLNGGRVRGGVDSRDSGWSRPRRRAPWSGRGSGRGAHRRPPGPSRRTCRSSRSARPPGRPAGDPCPAPTSWCSPSGTRWGRWPGTSAPDRRRSGSPPPSRRWRCPPRRPTAHREAARLDPVPRSSKLTKVNWSLSACGIRDASIGRIRSPLSPGPPGLNTMSPLLCGTGFLHHRQVDRAAGGVLVVQRNRQRPAEVARRPSGKASRRSVDRGGRGAGAGTRHERKSQHQSGHQHSRADVGVADGACRTPVRSPRSPQPPEPPFERDPPVSPLPLRRLARRSRPRRARGIRDGERSSPAPTAQRCESRRRATRGVDREDPSVTRRRPIRSPTWPSSASTTRCRPASCRSTTRPPLRSGGRIGGTGRRRHRARTRSMVSSGRTARRSPSSWASGRAPGDPPKWVSPPSSMPRR